MPADPGHWLLRASAGQLRERGVRAHPPHFTAALALVAPRAVTLFAVLGRVGPLAGAVLIRHGTTATYHVAWARPEGLVCGAPRAILWRAMRWCAEEGIDWLDLGCADAAGLARFKLGTGAARAELGGTWIIERHLAPLARRLRRPDAAGQSPSIQVPSGQKAWKAKANITS